MDARRCAVGVLAWLVPLVAVRAQDGTVPTSYAVVQREATVRAPDVLGAIATARAAHDSGPAPFGTPNPRLTVGTTEFGAREALTFYAFLPFFGRRQAAVNSASARADVADADTEITRLDARLAAGLAWIDLWLEERAVHVAASSRDRYNRLYEAASVRFEAGSVSRLDQIRARTEALRKRAELEALEPLHKAAGAQLAFLLGRDPQRAELVTEGELPASGPLEPTATLLAKLNDHPIYQRARAAIRADGVEVTTQKRQLLPFIGVQAGSNLNQRNGAPNDYNGAVLMEFPVYGAPLLKRARAAERAAIEQAELVHRRLESLVLQALAQLESAQRRARSATEEIVPAARETADLSKEAYDSGAVDIASAVTAEQAYLDADLAAAQAQAERARAFARLLHAVGAPE